MSNLPKIGLDLGTTAIKLVELLPAGGGRWKLAAAASAASPVSGILTSQVDLSGLTAVVAKLMKESGAKSRRVVTAIPEEQVSSHIVEMPLMSDSEVEQALKWQVEQFIPIPIEKAVWSHQVIRRDLATGGMEVLLVAVSKNLVNTLVAVVEKAGLEVVAVDTELGATVRSEVDDKFPLSIILDIGSKTTDLGIVRESQLVFSRTVPTAGEAFIRAIEAGLGLDKGQARQYLGSYGFSTDKLGGKLVEVARPVLAVIATEVKKTSDFYVSKHPGENIKLVVLSGGMAVVPDISGALSAMMGIEVAVGNPLSKVNVDNANKKTAKITPAEGPFYGVALGLAMREV